MAFLPSYAELVQEILEPEFATVTTLESSLNPAPYGADITYTATVTSTGGPVTSGTVQFFVDGVALGAPMAVSTNAQVQTVATNLDWGNRVIRAEYTP